MRIDTAASRAPMITAGIVSWLRQRAGSSQIAAKPMGGIHWNQIARNVMTTVASQKSGSDSPSTAKNRPT